MWINSVGISVPLQQNNIKNNNRITSPIENVKKENVGYAPLTANLWGEKKADNNIQFGIFQVDFGRKTNNPPGMDSMEADTQSGFRLSQLTNFLPCPDCGTAIMTKPIFAEIKKELDDADESTYLKVARNHDTYMYPSEKKILSFLETEKTKHPEKTVKEIVSEERTKRLGQLERRQYGVLDKMGEYSEGLNEADKTNVQNLLKDSSSIIFERQTNFAFQRGKFLELVNSLDLTNEKDKANLVEIASELPCSQTSETAWFVKYGGLDNKKQERTSRDIVEKLVSPTYTNTDHVHPHDLGGLDAVSNFWLMHARCNIVKTNKPFMTWLNENRKERTEYIHEYLTEAQRAIDESNDPKFHPKYDNYAAKLAKTIYEESNGEIDFTEEFPLPESEKKEETTKAA